jgi:6-phosphogluconate dehydrogenase
MQADIGLVGLAVMGQNLVLNMEEHGFRVAVFNRTISKVDQFCSTLAQGKNIVGTKSLEEFFKSLKRPRIAMLMVKAGSAVDELIGQCLPYLEKGDILIDGGNSHYDDTRRRTRELEEKGIIFLGVGISGGEEGARHGPSIMPGGNSAGWKAVGPIFQAIAAKAQDKESCCDWIGPDGAGHFVKMVHNGIEYGDMQLIAESYDLLRRGLGLSAPEAAEVFRRFNTGPLNSFLIEITAQILEKLDLDSLPLVDKILDVAEQKGTGRWTVISSLELGIPLSLISEATLARCLSSLRDERIETSLVLGGGAKLFEGKKDAFVDALQGALLNAKIVSYAQGFMLLSAASKQFGWKLNLGGIALLWKGGCIIRSQFLDKIKEAYSLSPDTPSLLLAPYFKETLKANESKWREVVSSAIRLGIPIPCLASSLTFFDGIRSQRLPANLIQAQRDFFGAHTYERIDRPRGTYFHTEWQKT